MSSIKKIVPIVYKNIKDQYHCSSTLSSIMQIHYLGKDDPYMSTDACLDNKMIEKFIQLQKDQGLKSRSDHSLEDIYRSNLKEKKN